MAIQQVAVRDTGKTAGLQGQFSQQADAARRLSILVGAASLNRDLPTPLVGYDAALRAYKNMLPDRKLVMTTLPIAEAMFRLEATENRGYIHYKRHGLVIVADDQDALLMTKRLQHAVPGGSTILFAKQRRESKENWIDAATIERREDDKPAPTTGVQLALPLH